MFRAQRTENLFQQNGRTLSSNKSICDGMAYNWKRFWEAMKNTWNKARAVTEKNDF